MTVRREALALARHPRLNSVLHSGTISFEVTIAIGTGRATNGRGERTLFRLTVWGKNDKSDLSARDRNAIAALVREIRRALRGRRAR